MNSNLSFQFEHLLCQISKETPDCGCDWHVHTMHTDFKVVMRDVEANHAIFDIVILVTVFSCHIGANRINIFL